MVDAVLRLPPGSSPPGPQPKTPPPQSPPMGQPRSQSPLRGRVTQVPVYAMMEPGPNRSPQVPVYAPQR